VKCYYIIREDLNYSSDRLMKIGVKSLSLITKNRDEWLENCSSETYMMLNTTFLYDLENKLIEDGIFFKWIEENNTVIGILIEPTEKDIVQQYVDDCLTLKQYASWRIGQFDELTIKKPKKH